MLVYETLLQLSERKKKVLRYRKEYTIVTGKRKVHEVKKDKKER